MTESTPSWNSWSRGDWLIKAETKSQIAKYNVTKCDEPWPPRSPTPPGSSTRLHQVRVPDSTSNPKDSVTKTTSVKTPVGKPTKAGGNKVAKKPTLPADLQSRLDSFNYSNWWMGDAHNLLDTLPPTEEGALAFILFLERIELNPSSLPRYKTWASKIAEIVQAGTAYKTILTRIRSQRLSHHCWAVVFSDAVFKNVFP